MSATDSAALLTRCLIAGADAVTAAADELNRLDAQAGDGDLGVTMARAAATVRANAAADPPADTPNLLSRIGTELARGVPSTSGTLLATAFLRASRAAADASPVELADVLEAATAGIQQRGKAELGDKTMVDALIPACSALRAAAPSGVAAALAAAGAAAAEAAERTAELVPRTGRASWMGERSKGHQDGGCRLVAIALTAAAKAAE